jgi:hypothetical protein
MCVQSQIRSVWDIMNKFSVKTFVQMSAGLESVEKGRRTVVDEDIMHKKTKKLGKSIFKNFRLHCAELGLRTSLVTVDRLLRLYSKSDSTYGQEKKLVSELKLRIIDEISNEFYFFLTVPEATRFNTWESGWEEILERFPITMRDVEEMNKCFALSRYTASMFHALHVAEWGAIYLGDYIGATDLKKGWGPTAKRLAELIKGGHSALPESLTGQFAFLEQMNREIDSMVLAWRNKVDHAANHLHIVPNTDFTPDIAEHVIGAVKIFMRRIAEGIPA